jgi:hypothetical protein
MAAPTAPTAATLVAEALTRFYNGGTPDSAEITRGISYGLEKIKRDIMLLGKTWRPLLVTVYRTLTIGKSHYDNPSDFEANFSVNLMSGSHTGTAQAGAAGTITLAADEDATVGRIEGKYCFITGGAGVDQARVVYDYNEATKIATVSENWATPPDNTSVYLICDTVQPLMPMDQATYQQYPYPGKKGTPKRYTSIETATCGQIAIYPVPDAVVGIQRKYYADLMQVDITEGATTLYTAILTRWADVLEQGVYVWKLGEDDDRWSNENSLYQDMLKALMGRDLDGYAMTGGK